MFFGNFLLVANLLRSKKITYGEVGQRWKVWGSGMGSWRSGERIYATFIGIDRWIAGQYTNSLGWWSFCLGLVSFFFPGGVQAGKVVGLEHHDHQYKMFLFLLTWWYSLWIGLAILKHFLADFPALLFHAKWLDFFVSVMFKYGLPPNIPK